MPIIFLSIPIYASFLLCICLPLSHLDLCNVPTSIAVHPLCISLHSRSPLLLSLPFLLRYQSIIQHPFYLPISLCYQDTQVQSQWGRSPEKETATRSSIAAWEGEPRQATVHGVPKHRHNWASNTSLSTSVTCLSKLPTYIYPSTCIYLTTSFFLSFLPSIHPSSILIVYLIYHLFISTPPTDKYPSPIYHLSTSEWLIHLSIHLWPAYLIYLPATDPTIMHISSSSLPSIYLSIYHLFQLFTSLGHLFISTHLQTCIHHLCTT